MAKKSTVTSTVRKLAVKPAAGPYVNVNSCIRIPNVLSRANKRLYRQHMNYRAKVSINTGNATQARVEVYALAPNWYVLNSLRRAKTTYDEVMEDELKQMGKSRWHDFRVNTLMSTYEELLDDLQFGGSSATTSYTPEYTNSSIHCSDGNDRTFVLEGASSTSRWNVFEEYDRMGNTAPSAPAAQGGYTDALEVVDNENVQHLQGAGDNPPYRDDLQAAFVKVGEIYRDANGNQSYSTGFFDAPLGLVLLVGLDPNVHADGVYLEVAGGKYKGCDAVAL
jgi:hypothetical protein